MLHRLLWACLSLVAAVTLRAAARGDGAPAVGAAAPPAQPAADPAAEPAAQVPAQPAGVQPAAPTAGAQPASAEDAQAHVGGTKPDDEAADEFDEDDSIRAIQQKMAAAVLAATPTCVKVHHEGQEFKTRPIKEQDRSLQSLCEELTPPQQPACDHFLDDLRKAANTGSLATNEKFAKILSLLDNKLHEGLEEDGLTPDCITILDQKLTRLLAENHGELDRGISTESFSRGAGPTALLALTVSMLLA